MPIRSKTRVGNETAQSLGCLYCITLLLAVPHRGFEPTACFDIWLAAFHIIEQLYDTPYPTEPQNDLPSKKERNAEIRARYEQGETVGELAADFEISEQRVSQIIHGRRD